MQIIKGNFSSRGANWLGPWEKAYSMETQRKKEHQLDCIGMRYQDEHVDDVWCSTSDITKCNYDRNIEISQTS